MSGHGWRASAMNADGYSKEGDHATYPLAACC